MITAKQFVQAINDHLDVPVLNEHAEEVIIDAVVEAIWAYVPPAVWQVMLDASDGLTPQELDVFLDALSRLVARRVNFGPIPEAGRKIIVDQVIEVIRKYAHVDAILQFTAA